MKKITKSFRKVVREKLMIPRQKSFIKNKKPNKMIPINKSNNSFRILELKDKLDDISKIVNTNELSEQIFDTSEERTQHNLAQSEQALVKSLETREELQRYLELASSSVISSKIIVILDRQNLNFKNY